MADSPIRVSILGNLIAPETVCRSLEIRRLTYYQVSLEGLREYTDAIHGDVCFDWSLAFLEAARQFNMVTHVMLMLTLVSTSSHCSQTAKCMPAENYPSLLGHISKASLAAVHESWEARRYQAGSEACRDCHVRNHWGGCPAVTFGTGRGLWRIEIRFGLSQTAVKATSARQEKSQRQ